MSWVCTAFLFFHSNSDSNTWMVPFQMRVLGLCIFGKNTIFIFAEKYSSNVRESVNQEPATHARTADTRTHNDTGRGFYDLYEINLFISTTAPSTFNIKIISTWAYADRRTCTENGMLIIYLFY